MIGFHRQPSITKHKIIVTDMNQVESTLKNDLKLKNSKYHPSYLYNILHIFDTTENNKCDYILVNEFY